MFITNNELKCFLIDLEGRSDVKSDIVLRAATHPVRKDNCQIVLLFKKFTQGHRYIRGEPPLIKKVNTSLNQRAVKIECIKTLHWLFRSEIVPGWPTNGYTIQYKSPDVWW